MDISAAGVDGSIYGTLKNETDQQMKMRTLSGILQQLNTLVKMKQEEMHDDRAVTEWKVLAKITDRIIFLICLISLSLWLFMTIM